MHLYGRQVQIVLLLLLVTSIGCGKKPESPHSEQAVAPADESAMTPSQAEREQFVADLRPQVEAFCGDCHAMPRPSSSSIESWVEEVDQGFMLYASSGRTDLKIPDRDQVLKFFQYQAPEQLSLPKSLEGYPDTDLELSATNVRLPGQRPPGVTNVRWMDIGMKDSNALVYCDIGTGAVKAHWPLLKDKPTARLATLLQPVHTEPCDLDQDGNIDLVVADIGEFNADDSDLGRVVWLRRQPDSDKYKSIVLAEGLSRVSDVRPGDFDSDGDIDLIVAVFGWRNSGRIIMLENTDRNEQGIPNFETREIDPRHGPVHVPPVDVNGDGHLDFVALISQDHESVEAFINDGKGNFSKQVIWAAPDPAYGSSGIELVDMDQDGDLDVLYTNGDSFDRGPKPYHSIQWLENQGAYPYEHHHLCTMPGVLNAKAADFDQDGDMDVVACALLAKPVNEKLSTLDLSSVVMLTQTEPGKFEPSKVEGRSHHHISLEIGDFNGDQRTDIAVGTFLREGGENPDLIMWWNES